MFPGGASGKEPPSNAGDSGEADYISSKFPDFQRLSFSFSALFPSNFPSSSCPKQSFLSSCM